VSTRAPRTDTAAIGSGPHEAPPPVAPLWAQAAELWRLPLEAWSAWLGTCGAVLQQRGGPAAGTLLQGFFDPNMWLRGGFGSLIEEMQEHFALPQFADLPPTDRFALPSLHSAFELAAVMQQYTQVTLSVCARICQAFQAEAAARRKAGGRFDSPGEALDLWNDVVDRTLMEFNRSSEFGDLQRRFVRAAMRQRLAVRKQVERVAEAVDLPTRTELDDVYRRLHDLLREVHALRHELRAARRKEPKPPRSSAREHLPPAETAAAREGATPLRELAGDRRR
jgi:hypothetical protein